MILHSKNILLLLLTIIAFALFIFKFGEVLSRFDIYRTDYPNYYFAGKRWLENEAVYAPIKDEVGWKRYKAYSADPPLTVIILSPLSHLPVIEGAYLLNIISVACIALSIFLVSEALGFTLLSKLFFTSLSLSAVSFIFLLEKVHMESILLLLASAGYFSIRKKYYSFAGILWGLAGAMKLFPLVWFMPYLYSKEKKGVYIAGLFSFSVFMILSCFYIGTENAKIFFFDIIPKSREWLGVVGNYSLLSFFTAEIGYEYGKFAAVFFGVMLFIYSVLKIKNGNFSDERAYAISTSLALLVSPLSWLNYYILIFPVLIFLVKQYNYIRLSNYLSLLILFTVFWAWPPYLSVGLSSMTILLSSAPLFALISILFHYQKKL